MLTQVRAAGGGGSEGVAGEYVRSCSNRIREEIVDDFFIRGAEEYVRFLRRHTYLCRIASHQSSEGHGPDLYRPIRRIFCRFSGLDPLLRKSDEEGTVMNWIYWLSGLAALAIFVYLVIALFKPE